MKRRILFLKFTFSVLFGILMTNISFAQMQSSITQREFTWTFDKDYQTGQFVNGDWWVIGPVTVTDISPNQRAALATESNHHGDNHWGDAGLQDDISVRNGSVVVDKLRKSKQGFDSRGKGFDASLPLNYPYLLIPNTSIVSSKSSDTIPQEVIYSDMIWASEKTQSSAIQTVSILTCLSEAPPEDAFRPSYVGNGNEVRKMWRLSEVDFDALLDIPTPDNMPSWQQVERYFERPWLNHFNGSWLGQELLPTSLNQPYYGREYARIVGKATLMLNTKATDAVKKKLLIGVLQLGIDLRGIAELGGKWIAGGGLTSGRKWPIIFAYKMFNDPYFKEIPIYVKFHEDTETYYGKGWAGQAALWQIVNHHGTRKPYMEQHPSKWDSWDVKDGTAWGIVSEGYRTCCNTEAWVGQALAALLMEAKEAWNHNAFFDNVEDWMRTTDLYASYRGTGYSRPTKEGNSIVLGHDKFVNDMWKNHRSEVLPQAPGLLNQLWVPHGWWEANNIIEEINDKTIKEEEHIVIDVNTVVASDVAVLRLSSDNLPSFCTIEDNGKGTAMLIVKPSFSDAGEYTINLKAKSLSFTEYNTSFILTVEESVGTDDELLDIPNIVLFPNPNNGDKMYLNINNREDIGEVVFNVFDISGREYRLPKLNLSHNDLFHFDISNLNSGMYMIVVNTDDWLKRIKFVVNK